MPKTTADMASLFIAHLFLLGAASAFLLPPALTQKSATTTGQHRYHMVLDPITAATSFDTLTATIAGSVTEIEVGAALVGAAAGALSQLPRVQALEHALADARAEVNATRAELAAKLVELDDKLFAMDQEYEEQTARFKRQYDATQKQEIAKLKEKLQTEMAYKLEIQLAERESERLGQQVEEEHNRVNRHEELTTLRLKQDRLATMNVELEEALKKSDSELKKIRGAMKRKRFLIF